MPPSTLTDPSSPFGDVGKRTVRAPAEDTLGAEQRVIRDVEAEHLLLEREPLRLVELEVGDPRTLVELEPDVDLAEQRHDPHVAFATPGHRLIDDRLEGKQEAFAGMTDTVEAAGFDQRLDRALVEDVEIDALTEVIEVEERTVLFALGDDQARRAH